MGDYMKKALFIFSAISLFIFLFALQEVKYSSTSQLLENSYPIIIIDAGHGGEDGGAVSNDGTNEKEINLQIALKLNEVLTTMGYNTEMIRTTDVSIHNLDATTIRQRKNTDLKNRKAYMDKYENSIYISIHQNKFSDEDVWGAQVFHSPNDERSKVLSEFIQREIRNRIQPTNNRSVKKSGTNIYILYNATQPAVMVECGFMSNQNELSQLKNSDYQSQMAFSIMSGIINYFVSEVKNGTEI